MEMVTLEVISGNYYFFPKTSMVVLKSTKFYDGRYWSLGVPQFSILLPCALPAVWGRGRKTSQILYISSICELGEQLCQQDRAMSCTPSLLFVNISLRCSVLGGERETERASIFPLFGSGNGCLVGACQFVHLIPTWLPAASSQSLLKENTVQLI